MKKYFFAAIATRFVSFEYTQDKRKMLKKTFGCLLIAMLVSADAFADTGLLENLSIPNGCVIANIDVTSGESILEPTWQINTYVCQPGYYLPKDGEDCIKCPADNYCTGGAWTYNPKISQGITECPNNWYSPAGMSELGSCGRILHVGDDVIYLRSEKKTVPSLNVKIGDDIFYGNMTESDIIMHSGTERKLKIGYEKIRLTLSTTIVSKCNLSKNIYN